MGFCSLPASQAGTEQSVIARTQSGTVLKTDGWHPRGNYPKPYNPKEPPKTPCPVSTPSFKRLTSYNQRPTGTSPPEKTGKTPHQAFGRL